MGARFYLDMAERVIWTAGQAFLASWLVLEGADFSAFFSRDALEVAAVGAAVAAIKAVVASQIGEKGTASTLPSA